MDVYYVHIADVIIATVVLHFTTHAPVHINDFRGVRASYVKRTG